MPIKRVIPSKYKKINPYDLPDNRQLVTVYAPDSYKLGLIATAMMPMALRVLLIMLARVNADGSVVLPMSEARAIFQMNEPFISRGINQLVKFDFISRKTIGEFWVNPKIAHVMAISTL